MDKEMEAPKDAGVLNQRHSEQDHEGRKFIREIINKILNNKI